MAKWQALDSNFEVKTSGSTGVPKIVKLNKEQMKASAEATSKYLGLKEGTKALLCLPLDKIAGLMMLVRAIEGKWDLTITEPTKSPLQDGDFFDFSAMVPYQVSNSINRLHQVEHLIIGGGEIPEKLESQLKGFKTRIFHTYGMTETITHIAMREISPSNESFFKGLPQVNFTCTKDERLVINAKHLGIKGLQTNDVVSLRNEKCFTWIGRADNVVNSAGLKLYPEELEKKIERLNRNFFLAGIPNDQLGEELVLVVEGTNSIPPEDLKDHFVKLDKYQKPKKTLYAKSFVYTTNGKLKRAESVKQALIG